MACTKQTARKTTGRYTPQKLLATKARAVGSHNKGKKGVAHKTVPGRTIVKINTRR